jgi:hypothetical protein
MLSERKLFNHLHLFDPKMPIAHNYLCYTIKGDKKTDHLQIDECIHKLPKALLDLASRAEGARRLFFPVALFSGQMFVVAYRGKLVVDEVPYLQYCVSFETEVYRREPKQESASIERLWRPSLLPDFEGWVKKNREEKIRRVTRELASHFQIDFVTEVGFPEYLARVEKEIAAVRTADWPIPETTKPQSTDKL